MIERGLERYLFDGAIEAVQKIDHQKILLTWGDLAFQKMKIHATGMDKIFDDVIFTEDQKVHFLKEFVVEHAESEIYFFNDNYNKRFNENEMIASHKRKNLRINTKVKGHKT